MCLGIIISYSLKSIFLQFEILVDENLFLKNPELSIQKISWKTDSIEFLLTHRKLLQFKFHTTYFLKGHEYTKS